MNQIYWVVLAFVLLSPACAVLLFIAVEAGLWFLAIPLFIVWFIFMYYLTHAVEGIA